MYRIVPSFHVSLLKPYIKPLSPSTEPDEDEVPSPPDLAEDDSIYQVRAIMDSRQREANLKYFVDWEGYGPEERSWVHRDDILDPMLLTQFHQDNPNQPDPRGRGRPCRRQGRPSGVARRGGGTVTESITTPLTSSPSVSPTQSLSPALVPHYQHLP